MTVPVEESRVREALEQALRFGEIGVAVAAYSGEELVVDDWIGAAAEGDGPPVEVDTLFPVFSVTKAMVATALHLQVERGLADYEAPVCKYWPEFAQSGKRDITVRDLLCHQSGMAAMPSETTLNNIGDWVWVTEQLAAMPPLHPPGTANVYHALSFGWLIGEVIRRTDRQNRLPCQFVREEILLPFSIDGVWLSLPAAHDHNVAVLATASAPQQDYSAARLRNATAPPSVIPIPDVYNSPEMRRGCNPSAGAVATARGVARFFAIIANGGVLDGNRLLSEERIRSFLEPRPNNDRVDEAIGRPSSVGLGGYWVPGEHPDFSDAMQLPLKVLGPERNILYHAGAGGSFALADLDSKMSLAICHNRMFGSSLGADQHPWVGLVKAARDVALERASA
jgi:CubicO group peptidase (beta-lactamase class C family)